MSKQPTDADYAKTWLQQRLDDLQTEMAVMHGRAEEIARLIGELDKDVRPPIIPTQARQPRRWMGQVTRGTNAELRKTIIATLRSAGAKGMRLRDLRDAMTAKGVTWPGNFLSIVLHEEKVAGNVEHNRHTGRHRWIGGGRVPVVLKRTGPATRPGPRLGYIGPNRQVAREVLRAAGHGGLTNRGVRQAIEAKGMSISSNLVGAILATERKAGNVTYDDPTGAFHWIGEQEPEKVEP